MSLKKLITWSQADFSDLPWRKNRTLYGTLVSEIMLQQTTVGTVKNHYERFLQRFPDLKSLALASEEELLVAWKGLGYYRRARNLKKISEHIFKNHKGKFPSTAEELQEIPGIGPYTSHALIAIGKDERGLAVDANLERVIARYYGLKFEKGLKLQKKILEMFQNNQVFKDFDLSYRGLNEALMDLGRTYCQARKASCELCPLKKECVAFKEGTPLAYPVEKIVAADKVKDEHELHLLRVLVIKKNKILVYKKTEKQWLAGQYEVPTMVISSTDKLIKQYPFLKGKLDYKKLKTYKTGITKYKIVNSILEADQKMFKTLGFAAETEWRDLDENANLSTASYKAIKAISLDLKI
jgi:A/G-specific adenine glycosylase